MARYQGLSPFQTKILTWSDAAAAGRVVNAKGRAGLVAKPILSFDYDALYAEPTLCHRVVDGEELALIPDEITEVMGWIDGFAIFGVDANGTFIGAAAPGEFAAEASGPPPAAPYGEQWVWDGNAWVDGRTPEQILEHAQITKIAEMWSYTLEQIEADAIEVTVSAGTYWFGMDSNTLTNVERTLLGVLTNATPDPRPWTPKGEIAPISVSHADIQTMATALGNRYDAWIAAYLTHKAAVKLSNDPIAVRNYDYSAGWPNQTG